MSGMRNQNISRKADFPKQWLTAALVTTTSITGGVAFKLTPGYKFKVVAVKSYCRVKAGTLTAVVKVGTRTAATVAFTTATETANSLSTTLANILGSATEAVSIEYTSDGSGALTNGHIAIAIRPWPLNGDLGKPS